MKRIIVLLIGFTLFYVQNYSQEWYPLGATWYFNRQRMEQWPAQGITKYLVEKDTLFEGKQTKMITTTVTEWDGTTFLDDTIFAYETDNKVYFWNGNKFTLKYDFNLDKGDTLFVEKDDNDTTLTIPVVIDSTGIININGIILKTQFISYPFCFTDTSEYYLSERIIEHIGSEQDFHFPYHECGETFVYWGMRCYIDSSISYKNEWWNDHNPDIACDSIVNGLSFSEDQMQSSLSKIFPNPTSDYVKVKFALPISNIEVYNITGEKILLYSSNTSPITLNLTQFAKGTYIVVVNFSNGLKEQHLLVKN